MTNNKDLKIGSLFSGYGGLDLAALTVFGGRVVWHSEIEEAAIKVLERHWVGVPNLGDITKIDWDSVEPIDILTGGFPCQDVSAAGKRKGLTEGTRSNLWVEFKTAIQKLKPKLVIIENVRGLLSAKADSDLEWQQGLLDNRSDTQKPKEEKDHTLRALGRVLGDLTEIGYDAIWDTVRASDVGAAHQRERVFILAYPTNTKCAGWGRRWEPTPREAESWGSPSEPTRCDRAPMSLFPTPRAGNYKHSMTAPSAHAHVKAGWGALAEVIGAKLLPTPTTIDAKSVDVKHQMETRNTPGLQCIAGILGYPEHLWPATDINKRLRGEMRTLLPTPNTLDHLPAREGEALARARQRGVATRKPSTVQNLRERVITDSSIWSEYTPAIQRWEQIMGRVAPPPTELSKNGKHLLSARFVEWLMGLFDGWVTDSGISRNQQLKMLGNGVVPLQAIRAIKGMLRILENNKD